MLSICIQTTCSKPVIVRTVVGGGGCRQPLAMEGQKDLRVTPLKTRINIPGQCDLSDVFSFLKRSLEAATISGILNLFGLGNLIFIRKKSGNLENCCLW